MNDPADLAELIRRAPRVYVVGNGGSYANAIHVANDLISVRVRAIVPDPATLTALANDHGYDRALALWLDVMAEPGDLLLAFSGSGKSPNIVAAMEQAAALGITAVLVTDYLRTMDMQRSEERQIELGHELMRLLRA